ncbi:MAG: hypothetical protein K2G25_05335 [Oscillospiraceae bacterium]|nr:hypothetical protein [Oscillospiraceae bacterium]
MKNNLKTSGLRKILRLFFSLLSGAAFSYYLNLSTTSMFPLFFAILLYFFYEKAFAIQENKITTAAVFCSLILTIFCYLAKYRFVMENLDTAFSRTIIYILGFFWFFLAVCNVLYQKILYTDLNDPHPAPTKKKKLIVFFSSFLILVLAWIPYFLYLFPGDVTADSNAEMQQAAGLMDLSNHHPIAHMFMIKIFYMLGQLLFDGNDTLSVATYSVAQMILLAAAFSYLILTLYETGVKKSVLVIVLLCYALPGYHGTYSVTMWKDIWFGGIVLMLVVTLWRILMKCHTGTKQIPVYELVMFGIFGVATCLFRSNGLYAFVFLLFFQILYFLPKKQFQILVVSVTALAAAMIIKSPIYNALGVTQPDTIESLSIPAQQISCAIRNGAELTEEQENLLSQVVDISKIPERYVPQISDSIKNLVRETDHQEFIGEHKWKFLKLWISLGLKDPDSYLQAHIDQTYGYWYPDVQYWVYASEFRTDGFELHKENKLPEEAGELLNIWRNSYSSHHYWGLFWSIGLATWIAVFMAGAVFVKKNKSFLLLYAPFAGVFLTLLIATPVFAEFRYYYSAFTTIPVLFLIPLINEAYFCPKNADTEIPENSEILEIQETQEEIPDEN